MASTLLTHATTADTMPWPERPGGDWFVACPTCGWTEVGTYGGVLITEEYALIRAHRKGTEHETRMNGKVAGT